MINVDYKFLLKLIENEIWAREMVGWGGADQGWRDARSREGGWGGAWSREGRLGVARVSKLVG